MRDHSKHIEVNRDEAVRLLLSVCDFKPRTETVPVGEACGRVTAAPVTAQLDMPNCLTCNMDSVAVHWDDFKDGMPDTSGWQRGVQWEFANTGIGMPEGFDTAIVIEHVQLADDLSSISFDAAPSRQYAGTSPAGNRMHAGDVLVPKDTLLTPLLVSLAASGNNATVQVYAKPVVAFLPTGNELVKPGGAVPRGKNIETNSLLAAAKIEAWGGICRVWDITPDDPVLIRKAVCEAAAQSDIVVLNAGSSKGSDDWNMEMLDEVGTVLYHQTTHGPGHHSSGAVVNGTPVVGISGPPGGVSFTMDFYLHPVMMRFLGQDTAPVRVPVKLTEGLAKKGHVGGGHGAASGAPKGEVRPSIVAPGQEFFAVKQLRFVPSGDGDGALRLAEPAGSSHPSVKDANTMDAYFLQSSLKEPPQAGDIIWVELRS
ncbi:MAG: hypothetical protein IJH83_02895 [Coriobacteriales bacterium]|nr:hypothetical protein [Coriobacteriales bacterium]